MHTSSECHLQRSSIVYLWIWAVSVTTMESIVGGVLMVEKVCKVNMDHDVCIWTTTSVLSFNEIFFNYEEAQAHFLLICQLFSLP